MSFRPCTSPGRVPAAPLTASLVLALAASAIAAVALAAPASIPSPIASASGPLQATPPATPPPGLVEPGAQLQRIATGYGFTEGPAVAPDGSLYFSDVSGSRIHSMSPSGQVVTVRSNTDRANGLYFNDDGQLVVCVMGGHRIELDDLDGSITVLADSYEGAPLVAPNDVWIHPSGGIYFTDPDFSGGGQSSVFYLPPNGGPIVKVLANLNQPNGVIGTPDGDHLYIADYNGHTWRYDIAGDGTLSGRTMLSFRPGDGMTLDGRGNVYVASGHVWIHAADGTELESIVVPETPSNMTFGGPDGRTLYITAQTSVYAIRMTVRGAFWRPPTGGGTPTASPTPPIAMTATATAPVTATRTATATAVTATPTMTATVGATLTVSPTPTIMEGTISPTPSGAASVYLPIALRLQALSTSDEELAPDLGRHTTSPVR